MRKLTIICSVLLGAATLAGCVSERAEKPVREASISLTAGIESIAGTKTDITDPMNPVWSEGDAIGLHFFAGEDAVVRNQKLVGAFTPDFVTATFAGEVALTEGEYTMYGYYPYGTIGDVTFAKETARIAIPAVQRPTATSFDPMADVMLMKPVTLNYAGEAISYSDLQFKRVLSTLKIKPNIPELNGEAIKQLVVSTNNADAPFTGNGVFDLTTGTFTEFYFGAASQVTIEPVEDIFANGTDAILVCVPAMTIPAGTEITFTGETEHYTFTKTVTVPAGGMEFKAGTFFNLGLSNTNMVVENRLDFDDTLNNEWYYEGFEVTVIDYVEFEAREDGLILNLSDAPRIYGLLDNFVTMYIPNSELGQEIIFAQNAEPWTFEFELYYDGVYFEGSGEDLADIVDGKVLVSREDNEITFKLAVAFTDGTIFKANYTGEAIDLNPPSEDVIPGENQMAYKGELIDLTNAMYLNDAEDFGIGGFVVMDGPDRDYVEQQVEVYLPIQAFDGEPIDLFLYEDMWSVRYYDTMVNYFISAPLEDEPENGRMTAGEVSMEFDMMTGNISIIAHFVFGGTSHLRINFNGPLDGMS